MENLFVNFKVAKLAKEKLFDEECLAIFHLDGYFSEFEYFDLERKNSTIKDNAKDTEGYTAATPQQLIDWLEENHNIHVSRIWYNDEVTPTRWVYHIDGGYAGSDFNQALIQALKRVKN